MFALYILTARSPNLFPMPEHISGAVQLVALH